MRQRPRGGRPPPGWAVSDADVAQATDPSVDPQSGSWRGTGSISTRVRRRRTSTCSSPARERRRWLRATPDTYRVGLIHDQALWLATDRSLFIAVPDRQDLITVGNESDRMLAASLLGEAGTVVIADVARPRLVGRRRVEPAMQPTAIATTSAVADEVGGVAGGDLVGFHRRLRCRTPGATHPRPDRPSSRFAMTPSTVR